MTKVSRVAPLVKKVEEWFALKNIPPGFSGDFTVAAWLLTCMALPFLSFLTIVNLFYLYLGSEFGAKGMKLVCLIGFNLALFPMFSKSVQMINSVCWEEVND